MEREKYLREVERTLRELSKHKKCISEIVTENIRELSFNAYRYGSHDPEVSENYYNQISEKTKIKNLIDYLILLEENKDQ
jgi:hypothetical protein